MAACGRDFDRANRSIGVPPAWVKYRLIAEWRLAEAAGGIASAEDAGHAPDPDLR
jgi:hypothetical protein